jgi:cytochrome c oxidase subunit 2
MNFRTLRFPALAAVALTVLGGCDSGPGMMMGEQPVSRSFDSNGERIYFTGRSRSGPPITFSGGNMHLRMMGGGCATCHGDHDRYTEASLRRAISEGLDAGGKPLADSMPRWSMDERQLKDLLEYLRS